MVVGISALEANHTWVLTPLPSHKKTIGCKWVYKARLVAKGFTQKEDLDYLETSSLIYVKIIVLRKSLIYPKKR